MIYGAVDDQSLACSTCSGPIQSKYTASGYGPSAKQEPCNPLEFNLLLKMVHKPPYCYATAGLLRIAVAVIFYKKP